MKLLKVAAIAAIVFSGSALAGVVPQYGGGGNHGGGGNNSGPNSELNITSTVAVTLHLLCKLMPVTLT